MFFDMKMLNLMYVGNGINGGDPPENPQDKGEEAPHGDGNNTRRERQLNAVEKPSPTDGWKFLAGSDAGAFQIGAPASAPAGLYRLHVRPVHQGDIMGHMIGNKCPDATAGNQV